ncbi:MAG TPA: ATP-binding protein [Polyangiaceae bacterium]|jgi:signal transduction histidine kinase|nr:ATP-binding protein [Polyangiaceae bacterium]
MSLRQKLLLVFSLTVAAAVAAVAWTVLVRIRHVFEQRDQEETALFVSQFQREFQHRSTEVGAAIDHLAASESARAMALQLTQTGDASPYLTEAQTMAQEAQLDFLEIVGPDGNIVSSAQWPARFGYPEPAVLNAEHEPFLKREQLPSGSADLGLFAVRPVRGAESQVQLIGGARLDQSFLANLPVAPGMQIALYNNAAPAVNVNLTTRVTTPAIAAFDPAQLLGANGPLDGGAHYKSLVEAALKFGTQASEIVNPTGQREDTLNATAIPLKSASGEVLAVLVVALSRAGMVESQQHIRNIAYGVAGGGILLAIVFSLWIAARFSRPIEQLAHAAEEVAAGNWEVRVRAQGHDEISVLARSFNHMTGQLTDQREQLIQSERVAAWRELARRLAHELKNPLFPLQLTVENLVRARALPESEFDEIFRESTATLSAEIANLKKIIGRFSDFSKMPKPELERIDASDVVARVLALYAKAPGPTAAIDFKLEIADAPMPLLVDPELLHRALSNLVLNAIDAMPKGGRLTLSARPLGAKIELRVADTGEGLTPEECERLFTPYYTTKQHGTGLGLAIVQSVVADHAGTISVESRAGGGAAFIIMLPKADA